MPANFAARCRDRTSAAEVLAQTQRRPIPRLPRRAHRNLCRNSTSIPTFFEIGLLDGVLARTMEAMVHAGGSTEADMFDFDLGELLSFMAFAIPAISIATVLVRLIMHLWARWAGRKPRASPWPVAMMLVMILVPVVLAFCLSIYRLVTAPPMRLEGLMVDVFLAAVLVAPYC